MSTSLSERSKSARSLSFNIRRGSRRSTSAWRSSADLIDMPSSFVFPDWTKSTDAEKNRRATITNFEPIQTEEIENLLRSLERQDSSKIEVESLTNYRTLIQAINLHRTPLEQATLKSLQQRENNIIQRNACRDIRYRSLLEILQPPYRSTNDGHEYSSVLSVKDSTLCWFSFLIFFICVRDNRRINLFVGNEWHLMYW